MIQVFKRKITVSMGDNQGEYYCAGYSRKGTADTKEMAEQMKEGSSAFTFGEIAGVTYDLPVRIKQALLDGKAVCIDGLGTFKPSLTVNKIQKNADDLKASAICIKSINFKPDSTLLAQLNDKAEYEWINASNANAEDANDTSDDETGGSSSEGTQSGGSSTPTGNTDMEG